MHLPYAFQTMWPILLGVGTDIQAPVFSVALGGMLTLVIFSVVDQVFA